MCSDLTWKTQYNNFRQQSRFLLSSLSAGGRSCGECRINEREEKCTEKLFDDVHNSQVSGCRRAKIKESAKRKEESLDTTAGRMIWAKSSSHRELQCICCTRNIFMLRSSERRQPKFIWEIIRKRVQQQKYAHSQKMLGCRAFHTSFIHSYMLPTARAFNFYFIFYPHFLFGWLSSRFLVCASAENECTPNRAFCHCKLIFIVCFNSSCSFSHLSGVLNFVFIRRQLGFQNAQRKIMLTTNFAAPLLPLLMPKSSTFKKFCVCVWIAYEMSRQKICRFNIDFFFSIDLMQHISD